MITFGGLFRGEFMDLSKYGPIDLKSSHEYTVYPVYRIFYGMLKNVGGAHN